MEYICIGKLVNTHGIKGEVRILSNFEYKEKVFVSNMHFYIGPEKECVTVNAYRPHKSFDMVVFKEYNYINDVLKFKGKKVYVDKNEMNLKEDELLITDYIGLDAYFENKLIGKVEDIFDNNGYKLFYVNDKYIPFNKEFIEKVDIKNNRIDFKNIGGML